MSGGINKANTKVVISDLNELIDIKTVNTTRGTLGGVLDASETTTFPNVWANIYNSWGKTYYMHNQLTPQVQYVITIRYRTGVSPKMVVYIQSYGERLLIRRVVDVQNTHEWIQLYCESIANNGV